MVKDLGLGFRVSLVYWRRKCKNGVNYGEATSRAQTSAPELGN